MQTLTELTSHHAEFFIFCFTLLGLMIGSFLNVVIHRLPIMLEREWQLAIQNGSENETESDPEAKPFNLSFPGSHCPACICKIKSWQNIPVVSFLLLKGRCANCNISISYRYPCMELLTAIISGIVAWHFMPSIALVLAALIFSWCLIALTGIDYDTYLLPDTITLPLIWLGLIVNYFGGFTTLESALWGAVLGYLSLWSVFWLFKLVTGKDGMGYGDFKLLAAIGAWLGWQLLPLIILLSSLVGAVIGTVLIVLKRQDKNKPIPFGPYLAAAAWLALIWGEQLNAGYWHLTALL
ncbi:MAG: A24 family peptidase [Pseudomonadales bacterium]|nr:A24 family peptidase [Pseudomonadales bacterium]